jgi:hypothetical protein
MRLRARVGLARRGLAVGASLRGEPKGFAVSGGVHAGAAARSRTAGAATGRQRSKGDSRRAEEGGGVKGGLRALEVGNITSWALLLAFAVSVLARHPRMQR